MPPESRPVQRGSAASCILRLAGLCLLLLGRGLVAGDTDELRWDRRTILSAPLWSPVLQQDQRRGAEATAVWPDLRTTLQRRLDGREDLPFAAAVPLVLATGDYMWSDTGAGRKAAKRALTALAGEEEVIGVSTLAPWSPSGSGWSFDPVWSREAPALASVDEQGDIRWRKPFTEPLDYHERIVLAYFSHLRRHPIPRRDLALLYLATIAWHEQERERTVEICERLISRGGERLQHVLAADRTAAADSTGFLIHGLSRPGTHVHLLLLACLGEMDKPADLLSAAERAARILGDDPRLYRAQGMIATAFAQAQAEDRAVTLYRTALAGWHDRMRIEAIHIGRRGGTVDNLPIEPWRRRHHKLREQAGMSVESAAFPEAELLEALQVGRRSGPTADDASGPVDTDDGMAPAQRIATRYREAAAALHGLVDGSPDRRRLVLQTLVDTQVPARVHATAIESLHADDPVRVQTALAYLQTSIRTCGAGRILRLLEADSPAIRLAAARHLAARPQADCAPPLLNRLHWEPDAAVADAIALALVSCARLGGLTADEATADNLLALARERPPAVAVAALRCLRTIATPRVIEDLHELRDRRRDESIQREIANVLITIGPAAITALTEFHTDADAPSMVRSLVGDALADLPEPDGEPLSPPDHTGSTAPEPTGSASATTDVSVQGCRCTMGMTVIAN